MSFLEDLKYDRPIRYRILISGIIVLVALGAVAAMPDTAATRAMGLVDLRERAYALREAGYWKTRALLNPTSELKPVVEYGFVVGIDSDKQVIISVPENATFVRRKVKLADVTVLDLQGAAAVIEHHKQLDARIDVYGDLAVIWIADKPLNVELVNAGLAIPDPNPPTNIVDATFAAYFWNKAKGKQSEN